MKVILVRIVDNIISPYTTVQKRILAEDFLGSIICSAISEDKAEVAADEITSILRTQHHISGNDDDDFNVFSDG
ncbi:MAG: hypothetical protein R2771_07840 [Saprospiraceae bacterium]